VPKPYDNSAKQLVDEQPQDWLRLFGIEFDSVEIIDADLSTVIATADKLIRVQAKQPFIAHIELQASYENEMAERFMVYNVLASHRTKLPVRTVVVLLRPEADGRVMREPFIRQFEGEEPYHQFHFRVVRLWQEPAEKYLEGGLGTLPLAPLSAVTAKELPDVIHRMAKRIESESQDPSRMWTATYLLMGLRYTQSETRRILRGVRGMKESSTYQAIWEEGKTVGLLEGRQEGKAEEALRLLLLFGSKRLGEPSERVLSSLHSITSLERLEKLAGRLMEVESWSELLAEG